MSFSTNDKFKLLSAVGDPAVRDKLVTEIEQAAAGQVVLTSGHVLVGNGSNVAADVALSGDATIDNTGAVTLGTTAVTGKALTGFTAGVGTVSATDTILQGLQKVEAKADSAYNGSFGIVAPYAETNTTNGGAISVTKFLTNISSAGAETRTLGTPGGAGILKIIVMTVHGGDVTVALTNVNGNTAKTMTFGAVGDCLVLMSTSTSKWNLLSSTGTIA